MPVDPQLEPKDPLPGPGVSPTPPRRLTRSTSDKHVAGVAGGLGQYFGVDPIIFLIGALCIAGLTMLAPPAFFFGPGLLVVAAVTALGLVLFRAFGGTTR